MRLPAASILAFCLTTAPALSAQEADLDSLRQAHTAAQTRVTELMALRDSTLTWAESHYRAIAEARREGGDALRDALRAAQVAADSLAVLDRRLAAAIEVESQARASFAATLESDLEVVLIRAELVDDQQRKAQLLARARLLAIELTSVQEPLELPATDVPQVTIEPADGPEEIRLKADFLADRATQLRRAAEVVESEMNRRAKRAELQTEMQRLVAEVRLFDQARVPPSGTQAGSEPLASGDEATDLSAGRFVDPGVGDEPSNPIPLAERGVDLPGGTSPDAATGGVRSVIGQLRQLRASLLHRAQALEARAEEIRSMLRGPP